MTKRTLTYVAGDWDGDRDAVEQLKKRNNGDFWRMIEFCDMHAHGNPVVVPLIGTGHSRVGNDLQQSLDYLVSAFNLNKDRITCDFHIVVWEGDRDRVLINK